jgi:hypothetical protein
MKISYITPTPRSNFNDYFFIEWPGFVIFDYFFVFLETLKFFSLQKKEPPRTEEMKMLHLKYHDECNMHLFLHA